MLGDCNKNRKSFFYKFFGGLVFLGFIFVVLFHGYINYKNETRIPSDKWSKEVLITKGKISSTISVLKYNENYILASNDEDKLVISIVDKLGKKVDEKILNTKNKKIFSIELVKEGKNIVAYMYASDGNKTTLSKEYIDLNKGIINEEILEADRIIKIDNYSILTINNGLIQFVHTKEDETVEVLNFDIGCKPSLISATKGGKGYMISYFEDQQLFKYIMINSGKVSEPKEILKTSKSNNLSYDEMACAYEGENGYIFFKSVLNGGSPETKFIKFSFDENKNNKNKIYSFNLINRKIQVPIISYLSKDYAGFVGTTNMYEKKSHYSNLEEFKVKEGKVYDLLKITRNQKFIMQSCFTEDIFCYLSYIDRNNNGLYMCSTNDEFKKINNGVRKTEIISAVSETFSDILYSVAFTFILGLIWIIPGSLIFACIIMFEQKINDDNKKKIYHVVYSLVALIKLLTVYYIVYGRNKQAFVGFLNYEWIGLALSFIISFISLKFGYSLYNKENSDLPTKSLFIAMFIDTLITQMLFVPFII